MPHLRERGPSKPQPSPTPDHFATSPSTKSKAVVETLPRIGPAYRQFDQLIQSPEFFSKISAMTGIPRLLYDPYYFGGGTHENLCGQDLDIHVDFNYQPKKRTHRRLNLIIFLNPEWNPEWGGCLELHSNPWGAREDDQVVSVVPLLNRCVTSHSYRLSRALLAPATWMKKRFGSAKENRTPI